MRNLLMPLCLAAAVTACAPRVTAHGASLAPSCAAPASAQPAVDTAAVPIPAAEVRIFPDLAAVPQPYAVVGFLTAEAGPILDAAGVRALLRQRAGDLGANGLVFDEGGYGLGSVEYRCIPAVRYGGS